MGRRLVSLEAALDAYNLLNQVSILLHHSNAEIPAAYSDLTRHYLGEWLKFNGVDSLPKSPTGEISTEIGAT